MIEKLKLFIPGIRIPNMNGYMKPYIIVPPPPKTLNKSWTQDEIKEVLNQAKNKRNPEEIAMKLHRPVSEVRSRLKTIAADMYLNDKIPYDKIQEATGVEKSSFIISPSNSRKSVLDINDEIEQNTINTSIYEFDNSSSEVDTIINVKAQDEMTVTISADSPFSVKSLCEHFSTPILNTCSIFTNRIAIFNSVNQNQH